MIHPWNPETTDARPLIVVTDSDRAANLIQRAYFLSGEIRRLERERAQTLEQATAILRRLIPAPDTNNKELNNEEIQQPNNGASEA